MKREKTKNSEIVENEQNTKPAKKPKKLWKRIVGTVLTILLVLILVFCILVLVQTKTNKASSIFGYKIYRVLTGSMEPTIRVGDVIIVKDVKSESEIAKGDIITFIGVGGNIDGLTVTHRVISEGVEDGYLTTCGDANHGIADKEPIPYKNVLGKYVKTSSVLTVLFSIFLSKYVFVIVIFIPLLILLIIQVINFSKVCKMSKDGKTAEEVAEIKTREEIENEIKQKAIEEYLKNAEKSDKNDN